MENWPASLKVSLSTVLTMAFAFASDEMGVAARRSGDRQLDEDGPVGYPPASRSASTCGRLRSWPTDEELAATSLVVGRTPRGAFVTKAFRYRGSRQGRARPLVRHAIDDLDTVLTRDAPCDPFAGHRRAPASIIMPVMGSSVACRRVLMTCAATGNSASGHRFPLPPDRAPLCRARSAIGNQR